MCSGLIAGRLNGMGEYLILDTLCNKVLKLENVSKMKTLVREN
jgi:hypothetical protein